MSAATPSRLALATVGCALAVAACGGSSPKHGASVGPYGPKSSPAAVSRCMRANGVSGFPDPDNGPGGEGFSGGLGVSNTGAIFVDGRTFAGPAVTRAEQACKAYLPPGGGPPPISESQRRQMIAGAQCMRRHGIPLPDPSFSTTGPAKQVPLGSGLDPESPAFRSAARACGLMHGGNISIAG